MLCLSDVGSSAVLVVEYGNVADSSLSAVKLLSFKGTKGCVGCGCFNALDNSNAFLADVSADDNFGIFYCLGNNSTVSHTSVAGFIVNMYCPEHLMM